MKLRKKIIQASYRAGACHIGSALSCVEIVESIYEMKKPNDVFIFAKASGVATLYCYLHPLEKAWKYLKKYPLPNRKVPGVLWSGGSCGTGLSVAVGIALAKKMEGKKDKVYCLISDGELNEGQIWEALQFSGHHHLNNLVIIVDNNRMQSLGETKGIINLGRIKDKFREFGFANMEVDGHDKERIKFCIKRYFNLGKQAKWGLALIANTKKGKGVDFMEQDKMGYHYTNLDETRYKEALLQISD